MLLLAWTRAPTEHAKVAGTQSAAHGIDSRAPPPSPAQGIVMTKGKYHNADPSKKTTTWRYVAQLTSQGLRRSEYEPSAGKTEPRPLSQNLSEPISFVSILFRISRFWLRPDIILRLKEVESHNSEFISCLCRSIRRNITPIGCLGMIRQIFEYKARDIHFEPRNFRRPISIERVKSL